MAKRIYLEPNYQMHSGNKIQFSYPPEGYKFVVRDTLASQLSRMVSKRTLPRTLFSSVNRIIPVNLVKSYLGGFSSQPEGIDLTYSFYHLVFRKQPWVVEFENINNLAECRRVLRPYRRLSEKLLASCYCKKIIFWSELGRKSFLSNLDCSGFIDKLEKITLTISKKRFTKGDSGGRVTLLFVNSANSPGTFERKGGKEVLEAFTLLTKRHGNDAQLVIRSDVPHKIKDRYKSVANIKFVEGILPIELLEKEYKTADIFISPGYMMSVFSILDAMSYELPIVTTEIACAGELVENGKTGFVIKLSGNVVGYDKDLFLTPYKQLLSPTRTLNPKLVEDLVEKISILIENEDLRRKMGRAGRQEIETGRFSIEKRNEKLKRIFDEATGGEGIKSEKPASTTVER